MTQTKRVLEVISIATDGLTKKHVVTIKFQPTMCVLDDDFLDDECGEVHLANSRLSE